MASIFSRFRAEADGELEDQVSRLVQDMAALKKTLGKRGSAYYADGRETAADLYDTLREQVVDYLPVMRKRARSMEKVARDNPAATAAVGLVVLGLLATMIFRR